VRSVVVTLAVNACAWPLPASAQDTTTHPDAGAPMDEACRVDREAQARFEQLGR